MEIKAEVVSYTLNLAKRMNSKIITLLLLDIYNDENNGMKSFDHKLRDMKLQGEKVMKPIIELVSKNKINITGIVKVGNPTSELLKFLADDRNLQTVVWGGDKKLLNSRNLKLGEHWMALIMNALKCPFVAPMV
ncbi:hypothetical protein KKB18_12030 [bacterium]|nr:hypothetical protein [bacterium]